MNEILELVTQARVAADPSDRIAAFGQLVERFHDMAVGYAYSLLGDFHSAEDTAQDAFLTAFQRLEDLREPEAFPGWLRRIVWSACNRTLRQRRARPGHVYEMAETMPSSRDPAREVEERESRDVIRAALLTLPTEERQATTLFYINGYSQREVAEFLEVSVSTVKNRLRSSRALLKRRLLMMVSDGLRDNTPKPDMMAERIRFLLEMGEQMTKGTPLLKCMAEYQRQCKSPEFAQTLADLIGAIEAGATLSAAMAAHEQIFPRAVISLVHDGELIGELDKTLEYAAQWLQKGTYRPDPHLFQRCQWHQRLIGLAWDAGAVGLVVRNDRCGTGRFEPAAGEPAWAEMIFKDGDTRSIEPGMPQLAAGVYNGLKFSTILDEQQEGSVVRGTLRIRPHPEDPAEEDFPITFDPCAGLGVAKVELAQARRPQS